MRKGIVRLSSIALAAGALAAPAANGDGLPIPGVNVRAGGVATANGRWHYVARSNKGRTTVRRVGWGTGKTVASTTLDGAYTVPAVALDGSPGGLSADGRRLALIRPRRSFPQARTDLVLLDARSLEVQRRLDLRGDFSFDAISPSGGRIYLIHYLSHRDPTRYAVVAYDVARGRLVAKPIVDPRDPGEQMRGYPLTRVAGPDGRWQYTLYSGGERPFVHALDTSRGSARCIDLPRWIGSVYNDSLRIGGHGATLSISNLHTGEVATLDTSTFEVSRPAADRGSRPATSSGGEASSLPWILIALGVGLAGAVAWLWGVPRHHRRRVAREG